MDCFTKEVKSYDPPQGQDWHPSGTAREGQSQVREVNQEWILGFNKAFGKVAVNAFVGGNKMTRKDKI